MIIVFMWTIYKVLFEFVAILFLFYVLVFWPWGMWGLSPTRNWTYTPCIGRQNLSHWTAKEVPKWIYVLNADFLNSSLEVKWSEVAQSCPNLCDPMDCSPPGSFIHGILQARILEWVAISFSRGSSQPRDQTQVFCIAGRRFNLWATRVYKNIHPSK